jgi:hypothetical protein
MVGAAGVPQTGILGRLGRATPCRCFEKKMARKDRICDKCRKHNGVKLFVLCLKAERGYRLDCELEYALDLCDECAAALSAAINDWMPEGWE